MEAMASGMVVVSTHHAGIPELVDSGVSGYLVRERAMESTCTHSCKQSIPGRDMGLAARRKIELEFNMTRQNEALLSLYAEIAGRPARLGAARTYGQAVDSAR